MTTADPSSRTYYAHEGPPRGPDGARYWEDIFVSRVATEFCGPGPVVEVRLREAREDDPPELHRYYGWLGTRPSGRDPFYSMIFSNRNLFEICFPNGSRSSEECGHGRAVRLIVERVSGGTQTPVRAGGATTTNTPRSSRPS